MILIIVEPGRSHERRQARRKGVLPQPGNQRAGETPVFIRVAYIKLRHAWTMLLDTPLFEVRVRNGSNPQVTLMRRSTTLCHLNDFSVIFAIKDVDDSCSEYAQIGNELLTTSRGVSAH
ncbi:MAG: hypothetical protein ACR2OX_06690 [Methyloligellaceae bacterium]